MSNEASMTTPTREQFELVARFCGVEVEWHDGRPLVPFRNVEFAAWTPHLPSADACVVIAKILAWVINEYYGVPRSKELILAVDDFEEAQASGNATQLCGAAFDLAAAVQAEREKERSV